MWTCITLGVWFLIMLHMIFYTEWWVRQFVMMEWLDKLKEKHKVKEE